MARGMSFLSIKPAGEDKKYAAYATTYADAKHVMRCQRSMMFLRCCRCHAAAALEGSARRRAGFAVAALRAPVARAARAVATPTSETRITD